MKIVLLIIYSMFGFSIYPQVSKQILFETVRDYEIDSLGMRSYDAEHIYNCRPKVFKYSIWWNDVFFVDKKNDRGEIGFFYYEIWSSLSRTGEVIEMNGRTSETGSETVKDLVSRWDVANLIDLFKLDDDIRGYFATYDPKLYIIKVVIRGGKIVSVDGIVLKGYHIRSKFTRLGNDY